MVDTVAPIIGAILVFAGLTGFVIGLVMLLRGARG